jgi:hypothetical protein
MHLQSPQSNGKSEHAWHVPEEFRNKPLLHKLAPTPTVEFEATGCCVDSTSAKICHERG